MKIFWGLIVLLFVQSCAIEQVNLSPLSNNFTMQSFDTIEVINKTEKNLELINYTSTLTNTLTEFPKFKNGILNKEINGLKTNINRYVNAVKLNMMSKDIIAAYNKYEISYQKIQSIKQLATIEEAELLNRVLVKIKTNIEIIDSFNSIEAK